MCTCDRPLEEIKYLHTSELTEDEIQALMIAQCLGEITFSDASSSTSGDTHTDDEWSAACAAHAHMMSELRMDGYYSD